MCELDSDSVIASGVGSALLFFLFFLRLGFGASLCDCDLLGLQSGNLYFGEEKLWRQLAAAEAASAELTTVEETIAVGAVHLRGVVKPLEFLWFAFMGEG